MYAYSLEHSSLQLDRWRKTNSNCFTLHFERDDISIVNQQKKTSTKDDNIFITRLNSILFINSLIHIT